MLASGADAFARGHDRGAELPEERRLGERRAAADGEAGAPPGAHRVLGRLPAELSAHAPLSARLARALRRRRPARDRRARLGLPGRATTRTACARRSRRLEIVHPVLLDPEFLLWRAYAAPGWPSRYLFAPRLKLFEVHHGEGDYHGTERAIQELLGIDEPLTPLADPADDDDVPIVVPTADVDGPYAGAYAAGEVWVVVDGPATITVNDEVRVLDRLGAHRVIRHDRHTAGEVRIAGRDVGAVLATAFLPGLA